MPLWLIIVIVVVICVLALSQLSRAKTKTVPPSASAKKHSTERDTSLPSSGKYGKVVSPSERFPNKGDRATSSQSSAKPIAKASSSTAKSKTEESDPILDQLKKSKGAWTPGGYKIPPGNKEG